MNDPLKDTIEKSRQHLADLIDKIEDGFESIADESAELWDDAKPRLRAMKASIVAAEEALQTKTEEARLQAHLAVMDAHDQWSHLSQPVIELARHAREQGQPKLEHAELRAHLAKMDARDFLNEKGEQISREFRQAKESVEQTSLKAAEELGKSLEGVGSAWTDIR